MAMQVDNTQYIFLNVNCAKLVVAITLLCKLEALAKLYLENCSLKIFGFDTEYLGSLSMPTHASWEQEPLKIDISVDKKMSFCFLVQEQCFLIHVNLSPPNCNRTGMIPAQP